MEGTSSVFPPPPRFYKRYTDEAWAIVKTGNVPDDLVDLQPPDPPGQAYRSFSNIWQPEDKLIPLKEAGVCQLYPDLEPGQEAQGRISELKKLLKSLLVNYLELVGLMSINPEQFPAKVEDMRIILINMHHLLNEYRPHQSRESLILLMEQQIARKRSETAEIRAANDAIKQRIRSRAANVRASLHEPVLYQSEDTAVVDQDPDLEAWKLLQSQGVNIFI